MVIGRPTGSRVSDWICGHAATFAHAVGRDEQTPPWVKRAPGEDPAEGGGGEGCEREHAAAHAWRAEEEQGRRVERAVAAPAEAVDLPAIPAGANETLTNEAPIPLCQLHSVKKPQVGTQCVMRWCRYVQLPTITRRRTRRMRRGDLGGRAQRAPSGRPTEAGDLQVTCDETTPMQVSGTLMP